jgi:hypothetical protein
VNFKIPQYLGKPKKWVLLFPEAVMHLLRLVLRNIHKWKNSKPIPQYLRRIDNIISTEQIWLMASINKLRKDTMIYKDSIVTVPLWLAPTFICRSLKQTLRPLSTAVIMKSRKVTLQKQECIISLLKGLFTIWIPGSSSQARTMNTLSHSLQRMSPRTRPQSTSRWVPSKKKMS